MMKYEIKTVREEENAAMQRVQDGLGYSHGRRRSSSSFGGWWGRWELTRSLPQTDTMLSEECVCHEIVHVVVAVGHYAVLCCATMTMASWADSWSWEKKNKLYQTSEYMASSTCTLLSAIVVCKYTYLNSPNIKTSTLSSTYNSFYFPQFKPNPPFSTSTPFLSPPPL